ncbi:YcxB family protein [Pseudoduganella sp. S-14]|uniref:YcxB family protein n=1 Tax=Pseudoduganella sp. S-14 TaxID=3404065 RepID=UPI003CF9BE3D
MASNNMSHQATLTYDKQLLRRAVLAFWRRSVGISLPLALSFATIAFVWLLVEGESSWFVGALGAALAFAFAIVLAIYVVHYRNVMEKLHDMGRPQALFIAEASTFSVSSGIGSSTMQWSSVVEIWCFPGFWLLLFSKAQFMTLPLETVSPEMQVFVLRSVQASGGKAIGFTAEFEHVA